MLKSEYKQIQWNQNHKININNIIERRCTQCGEWKEENIVNFYLKNKKKPELGYSPWCRHCNRTKANQYREDHQDDNIRRCHDYYHGNKEENNEKHQKVAINREKNRESQRIYHKGWLKRLENQDKIRTYTNNHRHHDITENEWRNCLKIFKYTCAYCGISQEDHIVLWNGKYIIMNFHKEHVDDEGYNDIRNAIPACRNCNSYKSKFDMEEWYRDQEFFDEERLNKINWWITDGYKDYIEDKPPYRILKQRNEGLSTYHFNLWSVDEMRNTLEIIATKNKRKELKEDIERYMISIINKV